MKKLIIFFLFLPLFTKAQESMVEILHEIDMIEFDGKITKKEEKRMKELRIIAGMYFSDLILTPELYNPNKLDSIQYISFHQDTVNYVYSEIIHASINNSEGFDKSYSIGQVVDYSINDSIAVVLVCYHFNDGSTITEKRELLIYDLPILKEEEYQKADYLLDLSDNY